MHFCNLNNEKNNNLKIRKSTPISRLLNGIVQIFSKYIQATDKNVKKKLCCKKSNLIWNFLLLNHQNYTEQSGHHQKVRIQVK